MKLVLLLTLLCGILFAEGKLLKDASLNELLDEYRANDCNSQMTEQCQYTVYYIGRKNSRIMSNLPMQKGYCQSGSGPGIYSTIGNYNYENIYYTGCMSYWSD